MMLLKWLLRAVVLLYTFLNGAAAAGGTSQLFRASNVHLVLSLCQIFMGEADPVLDGAGASSSTDNVDGSTNMGNDPPQKQAHSNNGQFCRRTRNHVHNIFSQQVRKFRARIRPNWVPTRSSF